MEGTGNRTRRRPLGNDRQASGQGAPHDASGGVASGQVGGVVGEPTGTKASFRPGQAAQGEVFGMRDMDPPGVIG